ncbi:MAG: hypothetical protein KAS72_15425 [Phycisphaerales bacterium]|nr:hypothetical protein [Phycisphaerales bacterium]
MTRDWDIPDQISVPIEADEDGFTGRECPVDKCQGYFKIEYGTGLQGEDLPCHCPYCGYTGAHDEFWTKEQIAYAESIAMRQIERAIIRGLKEHEFNYPAQGDFGIGISMKVKPGPPHPIRHYRENRLETEVVCDMCTLHYAIYGVFAHCPDCGAHNSLQILKKNLDLAVKQLDLAGDVEDKDFAEHLVADALENVVSTFDGFGRELCRVHAEQATVQTKAENLSFQNLPGACANFKRLFSHDLTTSIEQAQWDLAVRCFNKRHLLAHKMGVIDQKYIVATNEASAVVGRRVRIDVDEVLEFVVIVRRLGEELASVLASEDGGR